MATYNGAKFILAQLQAFSQQIRLPDELVICDDCSTDDTLAIVESFRNNAQFEIVVIRNSSNLGYTKNFEKALYNCTGDLIFLSDQDDVWFPNKVSIIEQAMLENTDKFLVIHDGELVDENLLSHGATKKGQIVAGYGSDDSFITGALTAVRREFLAYALPIPSGIVGHDGWLHNLSRLLGKRMVLDCTLQKIRRHTDNTSAWVASSVEPIGRLAVARSQFATKAAVSYQDRLCYNAALIERLRVVERISENFGTAECLRRGYDHLYSERRAIADRENLLKRGIVSRKIAALRMLFLGEYVHFNGFASFLRDLVR